jgi:hypothetical protein
MDAGDTGVTPQRKSAILTARLGIIQATLFLIAVWILAQAPGPAASDQELIDFYTSDKRQLILFAGLYLMPFAGIAFLWFAVALRMWISGTGSPEVVLLSNIQLVSAIVCIALFFAGAAAHSVVALSIAPGSTDIDVTLIRQFPRFGGALLLVFAMRMAAMFVFATTGIARKHGILPRWLIWLGFVVGLFLLLSASLNRLLVVVFPVWVLLLSAILPAKARRLPK